MNWSFELPPIPQLRVYRVLLPEDGFRDYVGVVRAKEASEGWQADRDACIAAALRWAAEQCDDLRATGITSDAGMFVREADLIDAAVRILAALPKE